jgi:hypothetical protein
MVDERVGLDLPAAFRAVAAAVAEPKALGVAAGCGDHGQVLWIDGRAGGGQRERRRAQCGDPPAQVRREYLLELDEGSHGRLLDTGYGGAGGSAKADRNRDRLVVVEQQRWHGPSGAESVSARGPGERVLGVAESAQTLDIAPDRPA